MKTYTLIGTIRKVLGRKVKNLRKEGQLPATVYGKGVKSIAITISRDIFEQVYDKAGETGLVELSIGNEKRPVLVHTVQKHPVSNIPLHVEFHQVDLKERVHAKVPVSVVGESTAVKEHLGVLLTVLDEIEVEALPADLPKHITVDVSSLAAVNQEFKVSNLTFTGGVKVLTDAELTVVKIGPLVTKEAEAQVAEETAAKAAAEVTTEADIPTAEKAEESSKSTAEEKKTS